MIWVLSMALAAPTPDEQAAYTGVFVPAESDETLDARWDAEVERVLPSVSWLKRGLARLALKGKRPRCERLFLEATGETFSVRCDDQDTLIRRWDGQDEPMTNEHGEPVDVDLRVEAGDVWFGLSSVRGSIDSVYAVQPDGSVLLTTTTRTNHATEPFRYHQRYRRE